MIKKARVALGASLTVYYGTYVSVIKSSSVEWRMFGEVAVLVNFVLTWEAKFSSFWNLTDGNILSYTVKQFIYVEIKCQLDATEVFIADLNACSTCFGQHYAHYQELKNNIQWLLPVVFGALVYMCGNKMPTRCNRGFYCRSYCLLNMFRAPLCPSSRAQE